MLGAKSDTWRREQYFKTRAVREVESNGNESDALSTRAVPEAESDTWINKRCLIMEAILDSKSEVFESKRSC